MTAFTLVRSGNHHYPNDPEGKAWLPLKISQTVLWRLGAEKGSPVSIQCCMEPKDPRASMAFLLRAFLRKIQVRVVPILNGS